MELRRLEEKKSTNPKMLLLTSCRRTYTRVFPFLIFTEGQSISESKNNKYTNVFEIFNNSSEIIFKFENKMTGIFTIHGHSSSNKSKY